MSTGKKVLIGAIVALVLGGIVFASIKGGGRKKGVRVYVEEAVRRDVAHIVKARGEVQPRVKVEVSSHVVAKIEKLHAKEGDEVKANEPFVELERDAFVAARDQARAQLDIARTRVRQAEVALADTRTRQARYDALADQGIVPLERREQVQLELRSAQLDLESAHESVAQARAAYDNAANDLTKTTIVAPIDGRVISLQAEEGEVVVSGMMNNPAAVIAVVADLSEILAEIDVDETEIVYVKLGQGAEVEVDAVAGHRYHGEVVEIGSSGYTRPQQPDVNFFKVKILLADADERLRAGMSARAEIEVERHADAVVVPIQAVVDRPPVAAAKKRSGAATTGSAEAAPTAAAAEEIPVVFVVDGDDAKQTPVEVGISDTTHVEVLKGVEPGAKVITGPYRTLRDLDDGDPVRVGTQPRGGDDDEDEDGESAEE